MASKQPPATTFDSGWASGAGIYGIVASAAVMGVTIYGVLNSPTASRGEADDLWKLGVGALVVAGVSGPIIAFGAASARHDQRVTGAPGLRIAGWAGYTLTLLDALYIVATSYGEYISNATIAGLGILGTLSLSAFSIDAFISAGQARAIGSSVNLSGVQIQGDLIPRLGWVSGADGRYVPTLALAARF